MKDIYTDAAEKAAHFVWQTASTILPQVGVWLGAIATGNTIDWILGKQKPAANQEPKKSWLSSLNPISALKILNPVSLLSFAAKPFTSVKKAASWFLFEELAHEMKDKIRVPFDKVAPIAKKFLTPILEKITTPAMNYLQDNGLMQFPKPEVVCPEIVCQTVVCELPLDEIKELAKQTVVPETQNIASRAWSFLTQPIIDLTATTAEVVADTPSPLENVFRASGFTPEFVEPIKEAAQETVKDAAKTTVPTTYLELTEKYAEPAGRYVADTMSSAYQVAAKAIHKPAEITHAMKDSINLISEAVGIRPSLVVAAGVGVIGLAGLGAYAAYHGAFGWYNKNKAVANAQAHAQANGGQANGNNVNFLVQFPLGAQQGAVPLQPVNGIPLVPQITEVPTNSSKPF